VIAELSIGAIYAYAMWHLPLTTLSGVVCSAPGDFSMSELVPVFSVAACGLGVGSAPLGTWIDKVGPVTAGSAGALCWFTGLMTCAAGAHLQSLPLIYLGYGGIGGAAWGLLYLTPVSTVMKWFPDQRGLATGITLSAFGAGAALAPPLIDAFTSLFFVAPTYLGAACDVALRTLEDGTQVLASDPSTQVVVATAQDLAKLPVTTTGTGSQATPLPALQAGVYQVGTGDSGAAGAFASLACVYGAAGLVSSQFMRKPADGWLPEGYKPNATTTTTTSTATTSDLSVPAAVAVRTPQFPLLWMTVFGNAVGGLALISSSKTIMTDIWSPMFPAVVTASFATGYVATLGSANSFGRLTWAIASDKIGRKNTYSVFALGLPVMAATPYLIGYSMDALQPSVIPLAVFVGGSVFAITNYGGIFSVLPAYIADMYGSKYSNAIHGSALTAWSASAVAGPMGLAYLRGQAEGEAIDGLLDNISSDTFENAFGVTMDQKASLIESKTITISRLLEISPQGVSDPTPHLYDTTFFVAAGFIGVAAVCNQMLKAPDIDELMAKARALEVKNKNKNKVKE
jgi:MFS family permease